MSKCLCCGTELKDDKYLCIPCDMKYGQSHIVVSQEEYQQLRFKEMLYDATQSNNEDKH